MSSLDPKTTALDDCFAFPKRRLLHAEAIALLRSLARPMLESESVSLFDAIGRVCAETVKAPRAIPAHTNAAVDGYAFSFGSYDAKEGTLFPLHGRAAAGDVSKSAAAAGSAIRIFTGAIMPWGCDTVVMQEDCRVEGASVFIPGGLKEGANRRLAGEDVEAGATVIEAGHRLRPQDVAAVAACGRGEIVCFKRPRVRIFSTGNEVLLPGAPFTEGKVYDSNGSMLSGLFAPLGLSVTYGGILPDNREAVHEALHTAAQKNDLIVTSGGASLGEEDHVIAALRATGALSLWQLAIKPSRPMGLGKIGPCLSFALPGNPVAVLVCALLYVWPVLRRLSGEPWMERKKGRREFFRGWLERDGETLIARKYEREGSGLISSLRAATGLIEISEDAATLSRGDDVTFIPFSGFGIL